MKKLLVLVGLVAGTAAGFCQGTISIVNSALSRMELHDDVAGTTVPVPTTVPLHYGFFADGNLAMPPATSSTTSAGIISPTTVYPIPGTIEGQTVQMQVRGWSALYGLDWRAARDSGAYFGETDVREVTLGPTPGPGTSIWQSKTGTDPHRFHPLLISGVSPAYNDILVDDITVAEGSNGVVNAVFTVRLIGTNSDPVTVSYATQDGTALAGEDYVATNGTITFASGETSRTVTVAVTADGPPEDDESFTLVLSNASNGFIRRGTGTCIITEARISEVRIDTAVVFHTVAGRHYAVERSSDLVTWVALSNASDVVGVGGAMTVHDVGVGCSGVHYYRTRLLNP